MTPEHFQKTIMTPLRDGEHYRSLFGRSLRYLLISGSATLLFTVAFVFFILRPENPELVARALIGLERTTAVPGAKEGVAVQLGREDIMMSRTFLRDVAQTLSLQLSTVPRCRDELFDSVSVNTSAPCGAYRVRFNPKKKSEFFVYHYDTTVIQLPFSIFLPGNNATIVASGSWAEDLPVHMAGMSLTLSESLRARPHEFTFHIVDIRVAVEAVYKNLTIKRADPEKGVNHIAILLSGRDYSLAAATANAIADAFIEKNTGFRQSRTRGIVASLEKQLQISQTDLAFAESNLRDFRSANPRIGLNQQTQQAFSSLAQLDNSIVAASGDLADAVRLKTAFDKADSSSRLQITRDIAGLLSARAVTTGRALQEDLDRLMTQQQQLKSVYGAEHPLVLENGRALAKTTRSISGALDEFLGSAQTALSTRRQNVQQLSDRLRQLPDKEMQLGELERNRAIYADIYSAVLGSYNQAKVADAVESTDFYVMDYAVAPLPPPPDHTRPLIVCVLIAILFSFGPVLAFDFIDKTVRSQRQLARISGGVVLEAIPFFFRSDETHSMRKQSVHPLIDVPCIPVFIREIFDSLLVKIKLRLSESPDRCIVVSGFESDSGKSTISANLAVAIAMRGHRTLLIDGDLRRGTIKEIFQIPDTGGLAALLSGTTPLTDDECMRSIVETKIHGLYVLPSGREPQNPGALLSSKRMEELRQFCSKHVTYTILDTPPLGVVSDAAIVQKLFSHYIFVVRSGATKVVDLVDKIYEFDRLPEKNLGYVLNGASSDMVGPYKRYSKYYHRSDLLTKHKHPSYVGSRAVPWATALLVGLGIAGCILVARYKDKTGLPPIGVTELTHDKNPSGSTLPEIKAFRPNPIAAPEHSRRTSPRLRNLSAEPSANTTDEMMRSASIVEAAGSVSKQKEEIANAPVTAESTVSVAATLREIRRKFAMGDTTGFALLFNKPAIEDGEYYLWMARYFCQTGEWPKALPLVEKALTVQARELGGDDLKKEYLYCKAKCLDAAFGQEPTPSRGAAAMQAWYDVKSMSRGASRDSTYLYADGELRRISKKVYGK